MPSKTAPFLAVAVGHSTVVGATILLWPAMYADVAWTAVVDYTTLPPWGWAYLAVAVVCLAAAVTGRSSLARAGLVASFVVLMATGVAVGWGVVWSWVDWHRGVGAPASPYIPAACLALAVVMTTPLRDP